MAITGNQIQAPREIILGQIVAKANNYIAVPDGQGGKRIIKSDRVRGYEKSFARQCKTYKGANIRRPFTLDVVIWYRNNRYDLDNSIKTLLDCLQYVGAIADDNLCTRINATKKVDALRPRVDFALIAEPEPPGLFTDDDF